MCFSAQASFIASALLTGIATLTYRNVRKAEQLPLATMPLLFALQQFAEGILWVLLPQNSSPPFIALAKYTFLSVAFIVWPILFPFAVLVLEKDFIRRLIIAACLVLGIAWSCIGIWYIVTHGATVQIDGNHLYYQITGLNDRNYLQSALYFIITLIPLLASSHRALQLLGGIALFAAVATYLFWYMYFISIWCFFAALISLSIYYIVRYQLD